MKKTIACIYLILWMTATAFSQTTIEDKAHVSGHWTKKNSPYIIKGEAIVQSGDILTIEPGVTVQFKTGVNRDYPDANVGFLRVNGKLIAEGTRKKMIAFTRDGSSGFWGVVYLDTDEQDNRLEYCKFEYGYYVREVIEGDNGTGVLSFHNSNAKVKNCIFANNGWTAINTKKNSRPDLRNLVIFQNKYGLECNSASAPNVVNTILFANEEAFYINGEASPRITHCAIQKLGLDEGAQDGGGNLFFVDPLFKNTDKGDFRLQKKSSCRKAGLNQVNIGLDD